LVVLVGILAIDALFKVVLLYPGKITKTVIILMVSATILLFYGYYFLADLQHLTVKIRKAPLRMRNIFAILFVLVTLIQFAFYKRKWFYKIINIYLLIFSFLVIIFPGKKQQSSSVDIRSIPMHPLTFPVSPDTIKPVLLLVADEYQSPDEMATFFNDRSVLNFSDSLSGKGWITKNSSPTLEGSTIYSIGSLMNFNLSENKKFSEQNIMNIGIHKLSHTALQDSLQKKNVRFTNYGIFDLGNTRAASQVYFYPINFLQHFLAYSSYFLIKFGTGGFEASGFQEKFSPYEAHNIKVLETLADTLSHVSPRTFVYAHLLMPHKPFQYTTEFPLRITNQFKDYKDYWNFTNIKLGELLEKLTAENKYRIILTGDHGFRQGDRMNRKNTFTAYYQFDSSAVRQLHSVQDIGSLINGSFN
jgi:hypothetical protein